MFIQTFSQGFYHICRERTQCDFRHLLSCFKKSLVVFKSKRTQSLVTKQILWRKGETRQRNNKNMPLSNTEGGLQQSCNLSPDICFVALRLMKAGSLVSLSVDKSSKFN